MRFEFYSDRILDVPKLSVDGTVPNSLHFSHWQGNQTPASVKADTSTEIALNLVSSDRRDELTQGLQLVTNNHFDTDGVLSVWTLLHGERANELRAQLISAAEAGDFSEWSSDDGVRVSLVIQGVDQPLPNEAMLSPLANHLAGRPVTDEAEAYELVLPEVEKLLTRTNDYEPLWRDGWRRIEEAAQSFERGESKLQEDDGKILSLVMLSSTAFGATGFNPSRHTAPLAVVSRYGRGRLFLIALEGRDGWFYRVDYPYYSWAETVLRPRINRPDLSRAIEALNGLETQQGVWRADKSELSSAIKFTGEDGLLAVSSLRPEHVAETLRDALPERSEQTTATAHHG